MTQKKIRPKPVGSPTPVAPGGVPKELMTVQNVFKLQKDRGNENYGLALSCLIQRFSDSVYAKKTGKNPHQLPFESVHHLINILNDVFPRNAQNRPLGVPEVALLFGAVLGTAASPALAYGEVTLEEIEMQTEVVWIALREWLAKGYVAVKHIEASGAVPKLVVPPGGN